MKRRTKSDAPAEPTGGGVPRQPVAFDPLVLDKAVIAIPLLRQLRREAENRRQFEIARERLDPRAGEVLFGVDLNPCFPGGVLSAREAMEGIVARLGGRSVRPDKDSPDRDNCVFAVLSRGAMDTLHRSPRRADTLTEPSPFLHTWWEFPRWHAVIIDLNLEYPEGREAAQRAVVGAIRRLLEREGVDRPGAMPSDESLRDDSQYVFAELTAAMIVALASTEADPDETPRAIFRIWPDFPVQPLLTKSVATVKADAARLAFATSGDGITWAVIDSGIDRGHMHFQKHDNLGLASGATVARSFHRDFTPEGDPLLDEFGHGTHVAGIVAGEVAADEANPPRAVTRFLNGAGNRRERVDTLRSGISGVAPKCRLVSLKVIDRHGNGAVSRLISALQHVQRINGHGRRLLIHGVNISLGYTFEPEWFACGQSPVCVEVDRLVRSGVVVVVAAGNTGYGAVQTEFLGVRPAGLDVTINDPGNADLAITVGATHREMPHTYGVSYFSSKGPSGDGRAKPDLVAPGEKIVSCATGKLKEEGAGGKACEYVETSGTSMAAPHVSGVVAAFLSVRREFIGKPERVKEIFMATATDLRRDKYFQGAGLVDLMRAIQSV